MLNKEQSPSQKSEIFASPLYTRGPFPGAYRPLFVANLTALCYDKRKGGDFVVINNLQAYDDIWNWIYKTLHFRPYGLDKGHDFPYGPPFQIPFVHVVYGIEEMTEKQLDIMDELVQQVFLNVTKEGQHLYALDWQHSGFLYDPRSSDAYESAWVEDVRFPQGGYMAFFPPFYPDGDYYFFIDENLQFGYLSHPWREEVWVFGETLVKEFEKIHNQLGWFKLQFEV